MSELPPRGAPIFAMGNPLDLGLTIAVGTNGGILEPDRRQPHPVFRQSQSGHERRPDLQRTGEVIGINVATARNDISFIVPSRFLMRLIARRAAGIRPRSDL